MTQMKRWPLVQFNLLNILDQAIVKQLKNAGNMAYYSELYIGNPPVKTNIIFDTGSDVLTAATSNCENCTNRLYNPLNSTTQTKVESDLI